jgi:hypothetical protein
VVVDEVRMFSGIGGNFGARLHWVRSEVPCDLTARKTLQHF